MQEEEDDEPIFIPIPLIYKELDIRPEYIRKFAKTLRTWQNWNSPGRGLPGHKFGKFWYEWCQRNRRWRPGEGQERMERILEQVGKLVRNEDGDVLRMIHILLDSVVGDIPEKEKPEIRDWVEKVLSQAKQKSRGGGHVAT